MNGGTNYVDNTNTRERYSLASFDEEWFSNVLWLWNKVDEEFVATQKVFSVGVADLHLEALKELYDASRVKPCVDHFNLSKCCVVSYFLYSSFKERTICDFF